jgi:PAS domain S-box-containing protein
MVMVDKDGIFEYINPRFRELFGYDLDDIPNGKTWFRKAYPDPIYRHHVISTWTDDLAAFKSGDKSPRTFRVTCKDGTEKIINFMPVQLETGENLVACEDITELKRAEEEKAVLQDQLSQSQKVEAIGRLAGGIAHDFNNLLTVIKGYSQLSCIELKEGDTLKGNIDEIQKAAERAASLTRQLLAFSRRQVMEMKVVDLNTLLRDLEKMLRRVIGEDIEMVIQPAGDLGEVRADVGQIEQVIMNLIVNAKDAMPSGGKLTIETANVELDESYARSHLDVKPGPYVMFSVSDTGMGMTPEVRDRIFEPFFTTKEKGKGTGLGLSTVYGIVKQSKGHIWVYSVQGRGTTFKIYLSRVDEPLEEIRKEVLKKELPRGNETILVVEDEEEVRKLAGKILERQGYRVLETFNGDDALVACERSRSPIHLMLADVVMPGMSGSELAKLLKPLYPEIKILYMSGYTDDAIVRHGVLKKGVNYIQKPFTMEGLARKVREVLDKDPHKHP